MQENNKLEGLTGLVLVREITDCYQLCQAARSLLGRVKLLDPIVYEDYSVAKETGRYEIRDRSDLVDGDIVIFPAFDNCGIGTYCQDMVLLYNRHNISTLVPVNSLLSLRFFGDPLNV